MDESGRSALLVFATQLAQVAANKNNDNYEQAPKKEIIYEVGNIIYVDFKEKGVKKNGRIFEYNRKRK